MFRQRLEEFEEDDEALPGQAAGQRSYDLIAAQCGGTATAASLEEAAKIRRLKASCKMYQHISDYATKSSGGINVQIQRIYKVSRKLEKKAFRDKYRMLLWHGTSSANVPGIIQNGFRPGSGGCFGSAVYFADRIGKSLSYTRKTGGGVGFLFIAEVNMGRVYKAHHMHGDYKAAPAGFHTVKGNGSQIPTWSQNVKYNGAILPCGDTRTNPRFPQYDLSYSEYMVYDPSRVQLRFLVECSW